MGKIVNLKDLSAIFGRTERTINKWVQEGLRIETKEGRNVYFDTEKAIAWYVAREVGEGYDSESGDQVKHNAKTEEARLKFFQASLKELEFKKKDGELIDVNTVIIVISGVISSAKTKLLSLSSRAIQNIPRLEKSDQPLIDKFVRESLEELADEEALLNEIIGNRIDKEDSEDMETTT